MAKPLAISEHILTYSSINDKNAIVFIKAIRSGFAFSWFNNIAKRTPFNIAEWSSMLNMSERTMQRYRKEKKSFDPIYSERILNITLLYNKGTGVFGDKEKFDKWLVTDNLALGGVTPKSLLDNSFGVGIVRDELGRIEHGVLA